MAAAPINQGLPATPSTRSKMLPTTPSTKLPPVIYASDKAATLSPAPSTWMRSVTYAIDIAYWCQWRR